MVTWKLKRKLHGWFYKHVCNERNRKNTLICDVLLQHNIINQNEIDMFNGNVVSLINEWCLAHNVMYNQLLIHHQFWNILFGTHFLSWKKNGRRIYMRCPFCGIKWDNPWRHFAMSCEVLKEDRQRIMLKQVCYPIPIIKKYKSEKVIHYYDNLELFDFLDYGDNPRKYCTFFGICGMNFSQFNTLIWLIYLKYNIQKVLPSTSEDIDTICIKTNIMNDMKGNVDILKYHNLIKSKDIFDLIYKGLPKSAIYAFTDGASKGNPGKAGAAAILKFGKNGKWYELTQKLGHRTNNQAELYAIWLVLKGLYQFSGDKTFDKKIFVFTDSALVVNVFSSSRTYRKNNFLIEWIYREIKYLIQKGWYVKFYNVKGHVDIIYNNIVDKLAVKACFDKNPCEISLTERPILPARPF